jgi:hypothetical protein
MKHLLFPGDKICSQHLVPARLKTISIYVGLNEQLLCINTQLCLQTCVNFFY